MCTMNHPSARGLHRPLLHDIVDLGDWDTITDPELWTKEVVETELLCSSSYRVILSPEQAEARSRKAGLGASDCFAWSYGVRLRNAELYHALFDPPWNSESYLHKVARMIAHGYVLVPKADLDVGDVVWFGFDRREARGAIVVKDALMHCGTVVKDKQGARWVESKFGLHGGVGLTHLHHMIPGYGNRMLVFRLEG